MAIDLAVALAAIAARAVVAQLVRGAAPTTDDWAGVAGEVAGAVVAGAVSTAPHRGGRGQAPAALEFDRYLASGRRYVRDLPDLWRTERDRLEMTRDARHEFIRAYSIAEQMDDAYRQAEAEIAIAGCWLWVPSLDDARKAMASARRLLLRAKNAGVPLAARAYDDVVELCRSYGVVPPGSTAGLLGSGVVDARSLFTTGPAVASRALPAVDLVSGGWVWSGSVAIHFDTLRGPEAEGDGSDTTTASGLVIPEAVRERAPSSRRDGRGGERVAVHVQNSRAEWISLMMNHDAIGVVLPSARNTLPAEHRVAPGQRDEIVLERPGPGASFPRPAAMVFTLPRR